MKNLLIVGLILLGVMFSGCTAKEFDNSYDRTKRASEKAVDGLEREFK